MSLMNAEELLDLKGCFRDDPQFQKTLEASQNSINNLETSLVVLTKLTAAQCSEFSKESYTKNMLYAEELVNIAHQFTDRTSNAKLETPVVSENDHQLETGLLKCSQVMKEIENSRRTLYNHLKNVMMDPLDKLIRTDLANLKRLAREASQAHENYDSLLNKYLGKKLSDTNLQGPAEEAAVARRQFHEKYLLYCSKLNELQRRKRFEVVETIVAMIFAQFSFFHQGYEMLKDLEPCMRNLSFHLTSLRTSYQSTPPERLDKYISAIAPEAYSPLFTNSAVSEDKKAASQSAEITHAALVKVHKADYLYKKSSTRLRSLWQRRYFELQGSTLTYYSNSKDEEDPRTSVDLRVCMVRECAQPERRFTFDLVSPMRVFTLQALNEVEMNSWISAIKQAISNALYVGAETAAQPAINAAIKPFVGSTNPPSSSASLAPNVSSVSPKARQQTSNQGTERGGDSNAQLGVQAKLGEAAYLEQEEAIKRLRQIPGNNSCADCSAPNPEWASCNLGVLVCLTCSGVHRGLGRHVSKVRSITLDRWEKNVVLLMEKLGNKKSNSVYEARLLTHDHADATRPGPDAPRTDQERWIYSKYAAKDYVWDETSMQDVVDQKVEQQFFTAIEQEDVFMMLRSIALGADLNARKDSIEQTLALQYAIKLGSTLSVEYLLQWQPSLSQTDAKGYTCLHQAVASNQLEVVQALLKRDASTLLIYDQNVQTALDLAEELYEKEPSKYEPMVQLVRFHYDSTIAVKADASYNPTVQQAAVQKSGDNKTNAVANEPCTYQMSTTLDKVHLTDRPSEDKSLYRGPEVPRNTVVSSAEIPEISELIKEAKLGEQNVSAQPAPLTGDSAGNPWASQNQLVSDWVTDNPNTLKETGKLDSNEFGDFTSGF